MTDKPNDKLAQPEGSHLLFTYDKKKRQKFI